MPPSGHPSGTSLAHVVPYGPEKITNFLLHLFGIDFLGSKKQAKTATGTRHYVNRLVPKNDIKLL